MKGFYIENFALRVIFCVVVLAAITMGVSYLMSTFVWHEPFTFKITNTIVPIACGVYWAMTWKPKEEDPRK